LTAFQRHTAKDIVYYTVPSFSASGLVVHGFSGRTGGVSQGPYDSLNLSIHTQDKLENVLENRRRLAELLGIAPTDLVGAHQVHEDRIYRVTKEDKGRGSLEPGSAIPATDALMTNERGLALIAFFADCVPVFFLDPRHKAIALAHAGWNGTVAKIAAKTVKAMQEAFNSEPAEILAAVGPSIGPCHYEVDAPVIAKFKEAFPGQEERIFRPAPKTGHAYLNLWEANVLQLQEAGIAAENITLAGICTFCRQEEFFSHRGGMAGRQAALIMLK